MIRRPKKRRPPGRGPAARPSRATDAAPPLACFTKAERCLIGRLRTPLDVQRFLNRLRYNTEPLVSSDFNHDARSSIFEATLTKVSGRLVKASSWYDNEWGFSNRMLDATVAFFNAK